MLNRVCQACLDERRKADESDDDDNNNNNNGMRATTGFGFAAQPAAAAGRVELTQDELNSLRKSAVNDPRRIQYGQLPPKSKASGDNDTDEDTDPPPPPPACD